MTPRGEMEGRGDMTDPYGGPVITEAEWQAMLLGARALREVGVGLRAGGAHDLAAESDRNAVELEGLCRRAIVAAARDGGNDREEPDRQIEAER